MNNFTEKAQENLNALKNNSYPGRGIVLGMTPDKKNLVQIYWIMGRSENSRNRIFSLESDYAMRTKAFDESKLEDPSLIIYYPARFTKGTHIITNGDQTDTVFNALNEGKRFSTALQTREYEPDAPNYTPRISGIMNKECSNAYELSILKTIDNDPSFGCQRNFFRYEKALAGLGHFISTYKTDGNPLPSFAGDPQLITIPSNDLQECANTYWNHLNENNRVSLMVKFIDIDTYEAKMTVINKHQ